MMVYLVEILGEQRLEHSVAFMAMVKTNPCRAEYLRENIKVHIRI